MAKPRDKDRDRRAVVERLRREQQRAERRRTLLVVAACVVVGLVIIGAALVPVLRQQRLAAKPLADRGVSTTAAGCQPLVKKKATGNQQHRPEGTAISYADAPPAFGPHYPVPAPRTPHFYTAGDRPAISFMVHNLEHGYTLLWYDDTIARDKDQVSVIRAIAATFGGTAERDKLIALPWTARDGAAFPRGTHVVTTHWSAGGKAGAGVVSRQRGVWQYCARPSGQQVRSFTRAYPPSDSPEPGAA